MLYGERETRKTRWKRMIRRAKFRNFFRKDRRNYENGVVFTLALTNRLANDNDNFHERTYNQPRTLHRIMRYC